MSNLKNQSLKTVMESVEGVTLREKHGRWFHFPFYLTEAMEHTSVESLELGVRANNALRRSGFHTIGDLAHAIDEGFDLKSVRSCGARSIREIMEGLFFYQYNQMSPEKQKEYLLKVVIWNMGR